MANDVRRVVGRIGRDVGRSSGCFQSLWSLAGLVARSKSMGGRLSVNLHVKVT